MEHQLIVLNWYINYDISQSWYESYLIYYNYLYTEYPSSLPFSSILTYISTTTQHSCKQFTTDIMWLPMIITSYVIILYLYSYMNIVDELLSAACYLWDTCKPQVYKQVHKRLHIFYVIILISCEVKQEKRRRKTCNEKIFMIGKIK